MEIVHKIEAPWWLLMADLVGDACAAPLVCCRMLIAMLGSRMRRSAQNRPATYYMPGSQAYAAAKVLPRVTHRRASAIVAVRKSVPLWLHELCQATDYHW